MKFYKIKKDYYAISEAGESIMMANEENRIGCITGKDDALCEKVKLEGEKLSIEAYAKVAAYVVEESERRGKRVVKMMVP